MDAPRPNSPYPRTPITGDALVWFCGRGRRGWPPEGCCSLFAAALLNLRGGWFYSFILRLGVAVYTLSVERDDPARRLFLPPHTQARQ